MSNVFRLFNILLQKTIFIIILLTTQLSAQAQCEVELNRLPSDLVLNGAGYDRQEISAKNYHEMLKKRVYPFVEFSLSMESTSVHFDGFKYPEEFEKQVPSPVKPFSIIQSEARADYPKASSQ